MADSEQGIGKKILGFFIRENTETETSPSPAPVKPEEKQKTVSPPAPTIINKAGTAQIDRKFAEHFAELLEKSNLPGPDYFEYKQALRSMEGLDLSEEKQFQAAWASFKAMGGVTETAVLKTSAEQYLSVLDKDRTAFLKDVEKALNERVGALNNEVKKLEENNKAYLQQIADLQKKMDENNNRLGQISGEIAEQSARITANRDNFEITYKSVADQILADLTKINSYLK